MNCEASKGRSNIVSHVYMAVFTLLSICVFVEAVTFELGTSHFTLSKFKYKIKVKYQKRNIKNTSRSMIFHIIFAPYGCVPLNLSSKICAILMSRSSLIQHQGHTEDKLQNFLSIFCHVITH